jgi:predicted pyridoxine 5'-phosphate oxidase superfamily flavin-nucleotide-binding protein
MSQSDVFSTAVKEVQARKGSRAAYAKLEARGGFESRITPELAAFIAARDSFFLATAGADGQPYVQHRGGPPGFLHVQDGHTLAFADFRGNRQYITLGNLSENERAFVFLIDWAEQRRIKLWCRARVVEDDPGLLARLAVPGYEGRPEQAIVLTVLHWNENCSQHIPQLLPAQDVARAFAALEAENRELRARLTEEKR